MRRISGPQRVAGAGMPFSQGRTSARYGERSTLPRFRCVQLDDGRGARDRRRHDGRCKISPELNWMPEKGCAKHLRSASFAETPIRISIGDSAKLALLAN